MNSAPSGAHKYSQGEKRSTTISTSPAATHIARSQHQHIHDHDMLQPERVQQVGDEVDQRNQPKRRARSSAAGTPPQRNGGGQRHA
jgi:hypothetical protein